MTVNVKRALIIAAAIVLAIAVISVVAVAGSKYVITIKNDRSNDFEISMGNIDLTQMDFLALSIPEDYENVVVWERMGVWGKHTDTQRNFVVHVEEVPSDTVIEIKDGVECKTKRLDGAKIYYETYLETVEFRDRTELWGWINYYYLNDICYIEVAHSILIPPECEDAEAYLEDEMIPHKQVFKIIKETYDQIKEVNGIK